MANGIDIDVGQSLLVGPQGPQGEIGPRGYGIKTIAKTGTDGLVDTYTVTFDDDRTATFEVTNGRAISSIDLTSTVENVDTYTITYNDGTTSTFTVTNSNVSREEFEEAVEVINSEMDDGESEGEEVKLTGVAKTNLDITVQGNIYQETTTGKNVLPDNRRQTVKNQGIEFTYNKDGTYSASGQNNGMANSTNILVNTNYGESLTLSAGTYYTMISDVPGIMLVGYTSNKQYVTLSNSTDDTKSFTLAENTTFLNVYIQIAKGNTTVFDNAKIYPIISATPITTEDWEKFTGNNSSPNPDYPQEIQVVTGSNIVTMHGKNFLNLADSSRSWKGLYFKINNNILKIENGNESGGLSADRQGEYTNYNFDTNKNYIFSFEQKSQQPLKYRSTSSGTSYLYLYIKYTDETTSRHAINMGNVNGETLEKGSKEIVFDAGKTPIAYAFGEFSPANTLASYQEVEYYLQLEEGLIATDYEKPYLKQEYPISLGTIELAKIGHYKDYLFKREEKWYKYIAIKKVVLNGSENWQEMAIGTTNTRFRSFAYKDTFQYHCYSNYFEDKGDTWSHEGIYVGGGVMWIRDDNLFKTINDLTTWLSTHNTILYYVSSTPTEEEITDTTLIQQLEALNKATANVHDLIITTETENLKPVLKVQYKESNLVKIEDLEKRIKELEDKINT